MSHASQTAPQVFSDHFAAVAAAYADFRPRYPAALLAWLAEHAPARTLAWDCATGSGQAARDLAPHFARVIATDASAAQIATAPAHPGVEYRLAPAEASGLADASIDLITVAQALHWFDLERFYAEARRVLKPGGLLAVWSYGVPRLPDATLDAPVQHFYWQIVGPYWPAERRHVENGYRDLPFPFAECPTPEWTLELAWTLPELFGYCRSWSATGRYSAAQGHDPVVELATMLEPLWGDPAQRQRIRWPLAVRVGRC